jgi:hypothetical protein
MKNMLAIVLCIHIGVYVHAQQNLGIQNSNYAGIQGSLLNPGSIADSKLKWDVNVISVGETFDNTFLFAPKNAYSFLGFRRIISGSIHEDLFQTHYDPQQPNKLYNVTFSGEALGPSFFAKIANKHEIGFTISARAYANINNITGSLAQNAFDYFRGKDKWNIDLQDNSAKINVMGWMQYGLHYAKVIYNDGTNELKAGITLNYLMGSSAAYLKNLNFHYKIVDSSNFIFTNSSVDYGRTDLNKYNSLNNGHGYSADLGFIYLHLKPGKDNYLYRIGLSLLDLGSINFKTNSAAYHLQTDSADFENWRQLKFTSNTEFDKAVSAVFYNGDSLKSLTANHFKMGLPTALSVQGDWNVCKNYYLNLTIIKGFGHGGGQGVRRPDVYSITPRYETKWTEVSIPLSIISYGHVKPRMGIAARYRYFFVGGDAPGSLLKLNNLEGVDFYAGIHFFIAEKK